MTFFNDKQISALAENNIFSPYIGEKRRTLDSGIKAISYGLSQAGYDIRLSSDDFLLFHGKSFRRNEKPILDPKMGDATACHHPPLVHSAEGSFFVLPPFAFGLGVSHELISMPDNIIGICEGKSTYARIGVIINVTPIEPGWTGHLTMHIANPTAFPVKIYANEGIVQVMLAPLSSAVAVPYSGIYQNQGASVQLAAV